MTCLPRPNSLLEEIVFKNPGLMWKVWGSSRRKYPHTGSRFPKEQIVITCLISSQRQEPSQTLGQQRKKLGHLTYNLTLSRKKLGAGLYLWNEGRWGRNHGRSPLPHFKPPALFFVVPRRLLIQVPWQGQARLKPDPQSSFGKVRALDVKSNSFQGESGSWALPPVHCAEL